MLSLFAKHSLYLQGRKETIQYRISSDSLHVLLKRSYEMFTDGRNIEKSYSLTLFDMGLFWNISHGGGGGVHKGSPS